MRKLASVITIGAFVTLALTALPNAGTQSREHHDGTSQDFQRCSGNNVHDIMIKVGQWCVDAYEASVWENPDGTGEQFGTSEDDYPCRDSAQDCTHIYAVSMAGVMPSRYITWFQAQQACLRGRKQLLPNAIWQGASAGAEHCLGQPQRRTGRTALVSPAS